MRLITLFVAVLLVTTLLLAGCAEEQLSETEVQEKFAYKNALRVVGEET